MCNVRATLAPSRAPRRDASACHGRMRLPGNRAVLGGVDRREERKGTAQAAAVGAILYKFELKAPQRPPLCVTVSRGEREGRAVAEAGAGAEK